MRFDELPSGWAQRPITDPEVFEGVVDLIATEPSRETGAIYLLLCHPNGRLLQPVCLPAGRGGPGARPVEEVRQVLAEAAGHGVLDVVVVVARAGDPGVSAADGRLRAEVGAACRAAGCTLRGMAVATPQGVRVLPLHAPSAAA